MRLDSEEGEEGSAGGSFCCGCVHRCVPHSVGALVLVLVFCVSGFIRGLNRFLFFECVAPSLPCHLAHPSILCLLPHGCLATSPPLPANTQPDEVSWTICDTSGYAGQAMSLSVADGVCSSPEGVVQVSPGSLADPGTGNAGMCDVSCSDFVLAEVSERVAGGFGRLGVFDVATELVFLSSFLFLASLRRQSPGRGHCFAGMERMPESRTGRLGWRGVWLWCRVVAP